jgi:hypothetical protein
MRFKDLYNEGRNEWNSFALKKTDKRWSFSNNESGKRYFIKLSDKVNHVGGIQRFLEDLGVTDNTTPKTKGCLDVNNVMTDLISGKTTNVHINSGVFDKIKKTWLLDM